jgi:DNA-binding transcriptional LysR family regulator
MLSPLARIPSGSPITRADRWPGLELRHVVALLTVADEASFHAAAQKLGYTQPAISQQIAALERIVGTRLLHRPRQQRPITLTEAGEAIARHGRLMMGQVAAAFADVEALKNHPNALLRIGTTPALGPRILPWTIQVLARSRPDVDVEVHEAMRDTDLLSLLELAELDVCLVELPLPAGPFDHAVLLHEPLVLVVQAHSPLAERGRSPALAEIAALPLLCTRHSRSSERALAALRETGQPVRLVCRSEVGQTLHGLVAAGLGVAVLPRSAADPNDTRTAVIDLSEVLPAFAIGAVWNTSVKRSAALEALLAGVGSDAGRVSRSQTA